MIIPKEEVMTILSSLGYEVVQTSQNVFNDFPVITFYVEDNQNKYSLDKQLIDQDITVSVNIWAEDSVKASEILEQVEKVMREHGYYMTMWNDIPNIDKSIFHIACRIKRM